MERREFIGVLASSVTASQLRATRSIDELEPNSLDKVSLAKGFHYYTLIKMGEPINKSGEYFGECNDFIGLIPGRGSNSAVLMVNHEYPSTLLTAGHTDHGKLTLNEIETQKKSVGLSILKIVKKNRQWFVDFQSRFNKRIDATSPIELSREISGNRQTIGTLANCSGGVTPWGTFLTCEENFQDMYGDVFYIEGKPVEKPSKKWNWQDAGHRNPENYGWVVEVDPNSGQAKKQIALGRFSHEGALVTNSKDGRSVVYMGDDKKNEFIYKFIAAKPGSLDYGGLFAADTINGRWLSLDRNKDSRLKKEFKDQTEVLLRCREAAKIVGATPQNRPEGIAINPLDGSICVCLTNNSKVGDYHGSILKIREKNGDVRSKSFSSKTILVGGSEFSSPDNLIFDQTGNLWFTTDVAGKNLNKGKYKKFGNNALFVVPARGKSRGIPLRIAVAPVDAEFTGPCFSPDYKSLFLSVQHPGETSKSLNTFTSHWPDGDMPKSSVIVISGEGLRRLTS